MSSSFIHTANPSSLPSDYAAIHRHAIACSANAEDVPSIAENDVETGEASSEPLMRSRNPTIARSDMNKLPAWAGGPTERTPLINPVPRIEEDFDSEDVEQVSLLQQYREEAKILARYTLPPRIIMAHTCTFPSSAYS